MTLVARVVAVLFMVVACPAMPQPGPDEAADFAYDLAFRGATLYRGGDALAVGDLAVRGDRIVAVGKVPGVAAREIEAKGLILAPGFIDLHNHTDEVYHVADWLPLPDVVDSNLNFLTQGVTTVVTGNCGSGFADAESITGWLDRVDEMPFGSNVAHLIPHGQLRLDVMGGAQADRPDPAPTAEELAAMRERVDAGMRAGAWGYSTGLEYDPGARSETAELVELARVVAKHGGIYASHTRHEGPDPDAMLASYAEAIAVGERGGIPAHISHIKLAGKDVHGMTDQVVALVEQARARGVRVTADQYPYNAGSTTLAMVVPVELRDGMGVLDRYCEGDRATLRAGVSGVMQREMPAETILVSVYPWRWWLQGRTVAEIAADRGDEPVEVAMDLACGWPGAGIYFTQNEADVRRFMQHGWLATASDGLAMHPFIGRFGHPRIYGTFPRKLRRYVLDEEVVPMPQALRSMTSLPADILGLEQRGRLVEGAFADLVAFDPARIRDLATFEDASVYSEGVEYVLVNGVLSIDAGAYTGQRGGRALRHASPPAPVAKGPPRRSLGRRDRSPPCPTSKTASSTTPTPTWSRRPTGSTRTPIRRSGSGFLRSTWRR